MIMMADVRGSLRGIGEKLSTRLREKFVPSSGWTEDSNGHYLLVDLPDFKKEEVKLEVNISAGHLTVSGQSWQENGKKHVYFEENFTIPPNSNIDKITGKFDGGILYVTLPKAAAQKEEKKEPEIKHQNVESGAFDKPHTVEKKNQILEGLRPKHEGEHSNKDEGGIKYGDQLNKLGDNAKKFLHEGEHLNKDEGRIKYGDQLNKLGNDAKKFLHEGEHSNKDEGRIKYGDQLNKLGNNAKTYFSKENIRTWQNEDGIIRSAMEMLSKNKGIIITAVVAFSLGMLLSTKFPISKKMT